MITSETPLLQTQFPPPQTTLRIPSQMTSFSKSKFLLRLRYYIPILTWLPTYQKSNLPSDLLSGLTVAFLIIPQSLSYAQQLVNVPAVIGLWSACVPLLVYSIMGTSRQLSVGPEALVSILVGSSVREYTQWRDTPSPITSFSSFTILGEGGDVGSLDPMLNIQATCLLCLLIGLFTFLLGFFRLGFLDSVLSRALLRGFVLAVACVVMIDMSESLFGLIPPTNQCNSPDHLSTTIFNEDEDLLSPLQKLISILYRLPNAHSLTTIVSFTSITFLLLMKLLKKNFPHNKILQFTPEILILVLTSTLFTSYFRWDCHGLSILNTIESTIPDDVIRHPVPTLPKIRHLLLSSVLISVIGFVESIVVAKMYASKYGYSVSPNRELVAMGVGNIMSSFFGGFPAYGSLGRSAVNDTSGAKTQLSGLITAFIVFITIMWLLPVFQYLPKCVCSSIIVVAALKLIEVEDIEFIVKLGAWKDLGLLMLTFLSTLAISIETGTLMSVGISLLLVVKHTTTTRICLLGQTTTVDGSTSQVRVKYKNVKRGDESTIRIEGVIILRLEEGLFFGNVGQLKERLKRIEYFGDLGVHPGEVPRLRTPIAITVDQWENAEDGSPVLRVVEEELYGVVFDMKGVSECDASATQTLLEIVEAYHKRNILVCFVKLRDGCLNHFTRSGIVNLVTPLHFYTKIVDAVTAIQQHKFHLQTLQYEQQQQQRLPCQISLPFRRSPQSQSQGISRHEITSFMPFNESDVSGEEDEMEYSP